MKKGCLKAINVALGLFWVVNKKADTQMCVTHLTPMKAPRVAMALIWMASACSLCSGLQWGEMYMIQVPHPI